MMSLIARSIAVRAAGGASICKACSTDALVPSASAVASIGLASKV